MRPITTIVIHISDSPWGCAREIRRWHLAKGWSDIGYHFVALNGRPTFTHHKNQTLIPELDGSIECGRPLDDDRFIEDVEIGAHALGLNAESVGICAIGKGSWTPNQWHRVGRLVHDLQVNYQVPTEKVLGHNETPEGKAQRKTCPDIDMNLFRSMLPT